MSNEQKIPSTLKEYPENPYLKIEQLINEEYEKRAESSEDIAIILSDDLKQNPASHTKNGSYYPWVMKHDRYYMTNTDILHVLVHGETSAPFSEDNAVDFLKKKYPETIKKLSEHIDFSFCRRIMGYTQAHKITEEACFPCQKIKPQRQV